jgi:Uncharacterized protein containing caspase domain
MKKRSLIPLILLLSLLLSSCELIIKQNPKPTINFVSVALKYNINHRLNGTLPDQDLMIEELRLLSEKAGYNFHSYRFREEDGVYTLKIDDGTAQTQPYISLVNPLKKFLQNAESFSQTDSDILIFYYSGHGKNPTGDLVLSADGTQNLPLQDLSGWIEPLDGKKLILLDSCFSGNIVTDTEGTLRQDEILSDGWNTLFGNAFSNNKNTWVMTASQNNNQSIELEYYNHGLFTYYLLKGLGASDPVNNVAGTSSSLYSMDGELTVAELYDYIEKHVSTNYTNQSLSHNLPPNSPQVTQNATSVLDLVLFKF